MKAALFRKAHEPLAIEDVAIDKPHAREVLVRTVATGVCHSDLHFVDGDLPGGRRPMVAVGHVQHRDVGEGRLHCCDL